ncbi:AraC family transcriptional regulator [Solirubrobacter soli]|uniref:AraC family transcriptional regulator n=1 Tax=Solirubrobacter soli TaxID=363832 RepID=UPI0003FB8C5C|nr:AraC family transcriptional regulator [Solirubrobacter soli]
MRPATYTAAHDAYAADTCVPLERAVECGELQMSALARGTYPGTRLRALPGVRTVGFWDAARPQSWGLDWHRNEGIELTWLESGTLAFATDTLTTTLKPGDLTITRPWQRHRVGAPDVTPGRLHWLILDVGVRRPDQAWRWPAWLKPTAGELTRLTELLRHNEHPVWPGDGAVADAFTRLGEAVLAERTRWVADPQAELLLAVAELLERRVPPLDASLSSAERTVALFLEELGHRVGEPWTLDALAAECGLKRTRFTHYCERITNMTPSEYLTAARVDRAAHLLTHTDASITAIAHATGFSSSQYFATVFRRVRGCSPSEYRAASG